MFNQPRQIDKAFQYIRTFSMLFMICCTLICLFGIYFNHKEASKLRNRAFVIANGKLLEAVSVDRNDSLNVEIRDHVKMFHFYFFNLEPDDEFIKNGMTKALYLADRSARRTFNDLTESGYFTNIISGNISQKVLDYDSIQVNMDHEPFRFKYFGKVKIVRSTSIVTRSLITEGFIRQTRISDQNPHGMLIERWAIVENKDLRTVNR
jgi:conjugative transposon TraK protein